MAEWLRRWTRNPMGFSLTGSNPVRDDIPFENFILAPHIYSLVPVWHYHLKLEGLPFVHRVGT